MGGYPNLSADDLLQVCNATVGGLEEYLGARLDDAFTRSEVVTSLKREDKSS